MPGTGAASDRRRRIAPERIALVLVAVVSGVVPTVADAYVDVVDASEAEAGLLGVAAGRGLLRMNCVTTGADDVPISLETSLYHPDRYRFRAILHKRARR